MKAGAQSAQILLDFLSVCRRLLCAEADRNSSYRKFLNTYLHTVQQKIRIYISYYESIPTNVIGRSTAGCTRSSRFLLINVEMSRASLLRGRWSCFFVTPFIIRVKKPKQKGKEREQGTNNALTAFISVVSQTHVGAPLSLLASVRCVGGIVLQNACCAVVLSRRSSTVYFFVY